MKSEPANKVHKLCSPFRCNISVCSLCEQTERERELTVKPLLTTEHSLTTRHKKWSSNHQHFGITSWIAECLARTPEPADQLFSMPSWTWTDGVLLQSALTALFESYPRWTVQIITQKMIYLDSLNLETLRLLQLPRSL